MQISSVASRMIPVFSNENFVFGKTVINLGEVVMNKVVVAGYGLDESALFLSSAWALIRA